MAMEFSRKLGFLVFTLCLLFSLKNQNAELNKGSNWFSLSSRSMAHGGRRMERNIQESSSISGAGLLRYDYYSQTCPQAEQIIRSNVQDLYNLRSGIAPELLRLVFHDCFIQGCDASVLLDDAEGIHSEKHAIPNQSLKGFDQIDIIKSELEQACPGVVSCADIVVLAARESVLLVGGPFYPLNTGRKDSNLTFPEEALFELPSPEDDIVKIVDLFESRGFDSQETVSLLGAHSAGVIHCKFVTNRLYHFGGANMADPSIDSDFLNLYRSTCPNPEASTPPSSSNASISTSAVAEEPVMIMDYQGPRNGFGTVYYQSLLQHRGLLVSDQALTTSEETENWVRGYASDASMFGKDFASAMMKLSDHSVLTGPSGQVRSNCRKVV